MARHKIPPADAANAQMVECQKLGTHCWHLTGVLRLVILQMEQMKRANFLLIPVDILCCAASIVVPIQTKTNPQGGGFLLAFNYNHRGGIIVLVSDGQKY